MRAGRAALQDSTSTPAPHHQRIQGTHRRVLDAAVTACAADGALPSAVVSRLLSSARPCGMKTSAIRAFMTLAHEASVARFGLIDRSNSGLRNFGVGGTDRRSET